jgi:hypothetical protein
MNLRAKKGVKIVGSRPEIIWCDMVVTGVFTVFGYECVITSGVEGKHMAHSKHPVGFARDYRVKHIPMHRWEQLTDRIAKNLTDEFQVVLEKEKLHIHI